MLLTYIEIMSICYKLKSSGQYSVFYGLDADINVIVNSMKHML